MSSMKTSRRWRSSSRASSPGRDTLTACSNCRCPTLSMMRGDCLTTNPESEGDRLPATYANFLILNKAVIYPTYNQPEKDEEARKQIQLAFPDREIIGVDSQTIIRQHGSIHCITMQLPEGALRDSTFHI